MAMVRSFLGVTFILSFSGLCAQPTWEDLPKLGFTETDTIRYFRDPKGGILMETRDRAIYAVPSKDDSEYGYEIKWDSKFDLGLKYLNGALARKHFLNRADLHILEMKEEVIGESAIEDLFEDSKGFMTGHPPKQMASNPGHPFEEGRGLGELRYSRAIHTHLEKTSALNFLPLFLSTASNEVSTPLLASLLGVSIDSATPFVYNGGDHASLILSSIIAFGLWPRLFRGDRSGPYFLSAFPDGAIRDPTSRRSLRMAARIGEAAVTFAAATGVHFCVHAISHLMR